MTAHAPSNTVPSVDSAANVVSGDVIGNKLDRTYNGGNSIFAAVHTLGDHAHSAQKVYPTLANGVLVTGGAGAYVLGSFAEIIPASVVNKPFDIHYVDLEGVVAPGVYELVLYQGASDTEVGRLRFGTSLAVDLIVGIPIQTPVIPADARIRAKLASAAGGAQAVTITLAYHEY